MCPWRPGPASGVLKLKAGARDPLPPVRPDIVFSDRRAAVRRGGRQLTLYLKVAIAELPGPGCGQGRLGAPEPGRPALSNPGTASYMLSGMQGALCRRCRTE